jgi:hypothetical protein
LSALILSCVVCVRVTTGYLLFLVLVLGGDENQSAVIVEHPSMVLSEEMDEILPAIVLATTTAAA